MGSRSQAVGWKGAVLKLTKSNTLDLNIYLTSPVDSKMTSQVDSYITPQGAFLSVTECQARDLDKMHTTISARKWIFFSEFLEKRVLDFIITTFCIPLL